MRAVFFGKILEISSHAAPFGTLPSWFSSVVNSEPYKQKVEQGSRHDLAHIVALNLNDSLEKRIRLERERLIRIQCCLRQNLSAFSLLQLNTPVSSRASALRSVF